MADALENSEQVTTGDFSEKSVWIVYKRDLHLLVNQTSRDAHLNYFHG
jgi:hypothetical protein